MSEVLAHNQSIHYLNLARNPLKDEGAMAVAEALRTNIHLFKLDLSGCALGPEGGIALAGALKANMVLSYLNLSNTNIGRFLGLCLRLRGDGSGYGVTRAILSQSGFKSDRAFV